MIVLDTHVVIWWVDGSGQLSQKAHEAIQRECLDGGQIMLSAVTAWEIAMLVAKGRLALTMDIDNWLKTVAAIKGVEFSSIDINVAVQSVRLPGEFHADPADRFIVALARHHSAPLVTADTKIQRYRHVKTIW